VFGLPDRFDRASDLARLRTIRVGPGAFSWVMTHLMGTCRMGPDPRRSATDPWGRVHHLDNAYVVDSSIFPTNLGVNPQHSIMGFSMRLARKLAAA
jgi:choline dehydrogenase-like flavoprotein